MEKVFRPPARRKSDTSRDSYEFKFQFHASRVPSQSWDKLVVSLIPYETGRATSKSAKGHVRNGTCQWAEALIESTRVLQDPVTREFEEKLYKLVVSMGSLRSGVLGEATINLAEFINNSNPESVALPLKNCSAGTVLHVKIQCLTPRTDLRVIDRRKDANLDQDDQAYFSDEDEGGSELSGNNTSGSVGSSASQPRGNQWMSSGQMKDAAVTSRYSSDSFESIHPGSHVSNGNSRGFLADAMSPTTNVPRRQDSGGSRDSSGNRLSYSQNAKNQGAVGYPSKGWPDSFARQGDRLNAPAAQNWGSTLPPENGAIGSPGGGQRGRDYARADLEAAESTIKELRSDAMTWERTAHKLSLEVETYKQQLAAERRHGAEFGMEISTLESERDSLKSEVEQLKAAKLAAEERESGDDYARWAAEDAKHTIKELQEEIAYEKEANLNLNLQLRKTQESNVELVSVIAELEESLEQQSQEIKKLLEVNAEHGSSVVANTREVNQFPLDSEDEWRQLFNAKELEWKQKLNIETELRQKLAAKNDKIEKLQAEILSLQSKVEPKEDDLEEIHKLIVSETEWNRKLADKEEEIRKLMTEISKLQAKSSLLNTANMQGGAKSEDELLKTIETLRIDMDELEKDCRELTEENMELIHKLNTAHKDLEGKGQSVLEFEGRLESLSVSRDNSDTASISELDASKLQVRVSELESSQESQGEQIAEKQRLVDEQYCKVKLLEDKNMLLEQQVQRSIEEVVILKTKIEEINKEYSHRETEFLAAQELADERAARVERDFATALEKIEALKASQSRDDIAEVISIQEEQLKSLAARLEEQHIDALRKTSLLEAETAGVRIQLAGAYEIKEKLEKIVDGLQMQNTELEVQLQESKSEQAKTQAKIRESDIEIAKFHKELASCAVRERNLEVQVRELGTEIDKRVQELSERVASEKKMETEMHELGRQRVSGESKFQDMLEERKSNRSRIEELEFQLPVLSEEIKLLNDRKKEFELRAFNLEIQRNDLEARIEALQVESRSDKEQLEALMGQLAALTTTLDSQLTAKRNLERRASELEKSKEELESQVIDLEEEILQLSERVSGLEAQLRYVTEERETHKLEKENVEARIVHLQSDKRKVEVALQEAVSDQEQKLSELEQKLGDALKEVENVHQVRHRFEEELKQLRDENFALHQFKGELEQKTMVFESLKSHLEQQLQDAVKDRSFSLTMITSLETEAARMKKDADQREEEVQAEIQLLAALKEELEERANKAEENLKQVEWEKSNAIGHLQSELQQLTAQLSSTFDEKEKMASEALVEASELRAKKLELEGSLRQMYENLRLAEEETTSLKEKLGCKIEDMATEVITLKRQHKEMEDRLQDACTKLEQSRAVELDDKLRIQELERRLTEDVHENQRILEQNIGLNNQATELERIKIELEETRSRLEVVKVEKIALESSLQNVAGQSTRLLEEKHTLVEKLTALEATLSELHELRLNKTALEDKLFHYQSLFEAQEAARIGDEEQCTESMRLKRQVSQFQRKMAEQEEEAEEFKKRVLSLEEELQQKADALTKAEKQLKERENYRIPNDGHSVTRSSNKSGLSSPYQDFKEIIDLEERLKFLEEEVRIREEELEICKKDFGDREAEMLQEFREREAELCNRIEHLEMSNEQLALGQMDSGVDQLQTELIRLQNQNSALSRREHELVSKLNMQDILQREVQRLQEANEQLETRLSRLLETVKNPHIFERVITLETELAEAMETNNMYKLQLSSIFEKQQNVSLAALHGLGDVDQVLKDFFELKRKSAQIEAELREMRDRYMLMSLKFAEVEAEKSELVIVIKNLRNSKRP